MVQSTRHASPRVLPTACRSSFAGSAAALDDAERGEPRSEEKGEKPAVNGSAATSKESGTAIFVQSGLKHQEFRSPAWQALQ